MKIKKGVSINGLKLVMRPVLVEAEKVWRTHGQELVLTSALDGEHAAGSLHYYGFAVDLRTNYFSSQEKSEAARDLYLALQKYGHMYRIITEETHIHVQFEKTPYEDKLWN